MSGTHIGALRGDADALTYCRDIAKHEFWDVVDSQPWGSGDNFGRACHCPERSGGYCEFCGGGWQRTRDAHCTASTSAGGRCSKHTADKSPFCEFHLKRAADWFLGHLEERAIQGLRSRSNLRFHDEARRLQRADAILNAARHGEGRVYFYELVGQGLVKIGTSIQVQSRVAQFRTGKGCTFPPNCDPSTGHLIGHVAGGRVLEAALHAHFRPLRVAGEWFRMNEELAGEIQGLLSDDEGQLSA